MTTRNYKTPPSWTADVSFEAWKTEVDMWDAVSDLANVKKAPALALSLDGGKREVAMAIPLDELKTEDGLKTLLDKLKESFGKETSDELFFDYERFEKIYRRDSNIADYVTEFEASYQRLKKHKIELPDCVLACKLLSCAGLDERDKKLVLSATADLKLATMKTSLRRIFASVLSGTSSSLDSSSPTVKEEPCFSTSSESALWTSGGRGRGSYPARGYRGNDYRGRFRGNFGRRDGVYPKPTGTNPVSKDGTITTCAKDCPEKPRSVLMSQQVESVNPVPEESAYLCLAVATGTLVKEAAGRAVLDSACTATIAGDVWIKDYLMKLPTRAANDMTVIDTKICIAFGGGERVLATQKYTLPIKVGSTKCLLEVLVVPLNLPLLFSVSSMTRAKLAIDFGDKTVRLPDKTVVPYTQASTVHILLDVSHELESVFCHVSFDVVNDKQLMKLHKQFFHCTAEKLHMLIKKSGGSVALADIQKVILQCDICPQFGRSAPKPCASLPLASGWNSTLALDLHQMTELGSSVWYLHIIDLFTRFTAAVFIANKKPETIIAGVLSHWCLIFGYPRVIMTDNGGEFDNGHFPSFAENHDIEIRTTAAFSPWSNGVVERHNAVLSDMVRKLLDDPTVSGDRNIVLQAAVFAKNAMYNKDGFSPFQLVYGYAPRLQSVSFNAPPALECETTSHFVAQHLKTLHEARKLFTEADCSTRIKLALQKQLRHDVGPFSTGEKVFYKRESDKWKGPGVIIGQDGAVVFVRHGGAVVKVHRTRLRHEGVLDIAKSATGVTKAATGRILYFTSRQHGYEGEKVTAVIQGRGGKASGIHKNWWNIVYESPDSCAGNEDCVDISKLDDVSIQSDRETFTVRSR